MITENKVKEPIGCIDEGLVNDVGEPKPGFMCVEAAVCYAFKEEHGDAPKCVHSEIRDCMISLNDALPNERKSTRAERLRKLAIAQLGTKNRFAVVKFNKLVNKLIVRVAEKYKYDPDALHDEPSMEDFLNWFDDVPKIKRKVVRELSEGLLEILIQMKTPGSEWLYLVEPEPVQQQFCRPCQTIAPAVQEQPQLLCVR